MKPSKCKGENCGKMIWWGQDETGKHIPLDPTPPIYHVVRQDAGGKLKIRLAEMDEDGRRSAMVSHYVTCPDRDQFSKKKGSR